MTEHVDQWCPDIIVNCECGFECVRSNLAEHREDDCPLVEIEYDVVGCDELVLRRDYEKHQEDAAREHVLLLSSIVEKLQFATLPQPSQVQWKITDIARRRRAGASGFTSVISSPVFNVIFRGNHMLYMKSIIFRGNKLGIVLYKDFTASDNKDPLNVDGSTITATKAGSPDNIHSCFRGLLKSSGPCEITLLVDLESYIDKNSIDVTLNLKLTQVEEPLVL